MIDFFLADQNVVFAVAIGFVFIVSFVEGLGLLIGLSLLTLLEQIIPIDVDADIDVSTGGLTAIIGWLCMHRLPLLVWFVLYLSCFGTVGYTINYILFFSLELQISSYLIVIITSIVAIYLTKYLSKPLSKILPKNESAATSSQTFTGLIGKITVGKASYDNPAEAVIEDSFQQKHYLLVAPEAKEDVFEVGTEVVLIEKLEKYWLAIPFNINTL